MQEFDNENCVCNIVELKIYSIKDFVGSSGETRGKETIGETQT